MADDELEFSAADVRALLGRLRGAVGRVPTASASKHYAVTVVERVDTDLRLVVALVEMVADALEANEREGEIVH